MAKAKPKRTNSRAASPSVPLAGQEQETEKSIRSSALFGGLRLVTLISATVVALVVYGVLQQPLGFWPALIVGLVAGVLARGALLWLERRWLRAVVRRATAQQAVRTGAITQKPKPKKGG